MRRFQIWVTVAAIALCSVGCVKGMEENSDDDYTRPKAKEMKFEKWLPGEVSYAKGDRTDWHMVPAKADGIVKIEVNVARTDRNIHVVVRDTFGRVLKKVNSKRDGKFHSWVFKVKAGDKFYVMVQAFEEKDASEYSIRASTSLKTDDNKILRPE